MKRKKRLLSLLLYCGMLLMICSLDSLVVAKDKENKGNTENTENKDSSLVLLDKVVATVNGDAIFDSEVKSKMSTGNLVMLSYYPVKEDGSNYDKALQDEINIKLALQASKNYGILESTDVEKEIEDFLKSRNLTRKQLLQGLESQGISYEKYKSDFSDQLILKKFQGMVIYPMIKISDRDLQSYYLRKNSTKGSNDKLRYDLRVIFIKQNDKAKQRADSVYKELQKGGSFESAAELYSDDSSTRKNGGLISNIALSDLSKEISSVVKDLKEGNYSTPIKTNEGYYIFYLDKVSIGENKRFLSMKKQLEAEYSQELYEKYLRSWLESQRRKSNIKLL